MIKPQRIFLSLGVIVFLAMVSWSMTSAQEIASRPIGKVVLEESQDALGKVSTGYYEVFEDRSVATGKKIRLNIKILHATGKNPNRDPVVFLAGGPGQGAADVGAGFARSWMRGNRDILLVNQRGTGGDNRLAFEHEQDRNDLQQYLGPIFDLETVKRAKERLSKQFDLRMYSTPIAMDDLNDIRQHLGYEKINLVGGSYGTRAALVYIRRHGETVRSATLNGVAPIEFTNPLFHAQSAQRTLDLIFDEIENNELYNENLPGLRQKFNELMTQFDKGPIEVEVGEGDEIQKVMLSKDAFTGALRFQLYYMDTSRKLPVLLWRAVNGNLRPFAESSIRRNRGLGNSIAMGMLLSVTAAEDIDRINPNDIEPLCGSTFYGGGRVWRQIEACKLWPKSKLPENFGEPVVSDVPTLILSGSIDPVTPPKWGELVHQNFANSIHIIAPAAHGVGGECIDAIQREFLKTASVEGLDTSCVDQLTMPPLYLPKENFK